MLYQVEHRQPILEILKTETRRLSLGLRRERRPARPGVVRGFYTRPAFCKPPGKPFCRAKILSVHREKLGDITLDGAKREGCSSVDDYVGVWDRVYGLGAWVQHAERLVWVVRFQMLVQLGCAGCGAHGELGRMVRKDHPGPDPIAWYCADCGGGKIEP